MSQILKWARDYEHGEASLSFSLRPSIRPSVSWEKTIKFVIKLFKIISICILDGQEIQAKVYKNIIAHETHYFSCVSTPIWPLKAKYKVTGPIDINSITQVIA